MRIGYTGPFGDSNFGDTAMAINDILDVGYKNITVFTYDSQLFASLANCYLPEYEIAIVEVSTANRVPFSQNSNCSASAASSPKPIDTPLDILNHIDNLKELKESINEIDTLVVTGGGFLNDLWHQPHRINKLASIIAPIIIANQLKKKIVFFGNTFGPYDSSSTFFRSFFSSLNNVAFASRDDYLSPTNLRALGLANCCSILPDDLYFSNKRFEDFSNTYTPENPYLILELYPTTDEVEKLIEPLKRFSHEIKDKYSLDIIFLPLDTKYGGQIQGEIIKNNIPDIILINEYFDGLYIPYEKIYTLVKNASFVVCQRYHLFLLAIANNTPSVQVLRPVCGSTVYYYQKAIGLLRSIFANQKWDEQDFLYIDIEEALNAISDNLPQIIKSQQSLFNDSKRYQEEALKELREKYISTNFG